MQRNSANVKLYFHIDANYYHVHLNQQTALVTRSWVDPGTYVQNSAPGHRAVKPRCRFIDLTLNRLSWPVIPSGVPSLPDALQSRV